MEVPDLVDWIFLILGLAVYFDATHHTVGHVKEVKTFPNMTAGSWATWASIPYLGLVAAAFYMLHRGNLIRRARQHPVYLSSVHRVAVAALLFILPMLLAYLLPSFD